MTHKQGTIAWPCGHPKTPENTTGSSAVPHCKQCRATYYAARHAVTEQRNRELVEDHCDGMSLTQLMRKYGLGTYTVQKILRKYGPEKPEPYPVGRLIDVAAGMSLFSSDDITGKSRVRALVRLRAAIAFVAKEQGHSFRAIGDSLGGRDHSTIMSLAERVPVHSRADAGFVELLSRLRAFAKGNRQQSDFVFDPNRERDARPAKPRVRRARKPRVRKVRDSGFHTMVSNGSQRLLAAIQREHAI